MFFWFQNSFGTHITTRFSLAVTTFTYQTLRTRLASGIGHVMLLEVKFLEGSTRLYQT